MLLETEFTSLYLKHRGPKANVTRAPSLSLNILALLIVQDLSRSPSFTRLATFVVRWFGQVLAFFLRFLQVDSTNTYQLVFPLFMVLLVGHLG